MFGIDSPELLVIAVVALIAIGPKELPGLLRTWGKWMAQMRGMASEFRGHVDEMIRQSELDQVKKELEAGAGGLDLKALDPTKQIREHIQEGMTEGEKAIAEAKSDLEKPAEPVDSPLAEPDSAPQIGADPVADAPAEPVAEAPAEPVAEAQPAHPQEKSEEKPKAAA
jgi:sec-independent protein translocase protein TatB